MSNKLQAEREVAEQESIESRRERLAEVKFCMGIYCDGKCDMRQCPSKFDIW
jgi:hypothetical protein